MNLTKSVNFERCNTLADVTYGLQLEPIVRLQDEKRWQQHATVSTKKSLLSFEEMEQYGQVIPKEKLDRSTVVRYVLSLPEQKEIKRQVNNNRFGIERVELLSKYTALDGKLDTNHAMQTIAVAELVFLNYIENLSIIKNSKETLNKKYKNGKKNENKQEEPEESLLYNADFESLEKNFMMFGDEKYSKTSKFPISPLFISEKSENEVMIEGKRILKAAERQLDLIVHSFVVNQDNSAKEINALKTAKKMWNLVHIMRMATVSGLKKLRECASKVQKFTTVAHELFVNALALSGTRNSIALLVDMIEQHEIDETKISQVLKIIGSGSGLPAPSESQVDLVLRLYKSNVLKSSSLKHTCWLTFGTMVGELSLQSQNAKKLGKTESPTKSIEIATAHKMDLYKQVKFIFYFFSFFLYFLILKKKLVY